MDNTFLVSVANAIGLNPTTKEAIFFGKANIDSAFELSMASTDVRGGINNPLLYKYMHDRDLKVSINQAVFEKSFLALNAGTTIANSTVSVLKTECIQLSSGVGTVTETPIGNVSVKKDDGTFVTVTPTVKSITVSGGGDTMVTAIYRYSDTVDRIAIKTTTPPSVIDLYLIAEVRTNSGVVVEYLQINVPRFQIDGNYTLDFSADGVSREALTGNALSVAGTTCSDGDIFAYVSWVPAGSTAVAYGEICATPALYEPTHGVLSTRQITVTGIRGSLYDATSITSGCTFTKASGDADITVSAGGLITVAATSTAGDSAIIEVTYGALKDIVLVDVQ